MASVTKADIPEISSFMTDFWNLVKKYWIPEDPDSKYWDDLFSDMHALWQKSGENDFALKMLIAFVDYEDAEMKKLYPR